MASHHALDAVPIDQAHGKTRVCGKWVEVLRSYAAIAITEVRPRLVPA